MPTTVYKACKIVHETSEEAIPNIIVFGFIWQLKRWWINIS